jgi:tRNA dimethylallyltransferase
MDDIISRGKVPVIVGGTGLYIDSLLSGRSFATRADADARREIEARYDDIGGAAMRRELSGFDREAAVRIMAGDKKRIVRAFEISRTTGKTATQHDEETRRLPPRYDAVKFALTFKDRATLYARIDRRVDTMIEAGLESEVRRLLGAGVGRTAMQAIGNKEMADAVSRGGGTEDARDIIKRRSRKLAKRQLTWLRAKPDVDWIVWDSAPDLDLGLHIVTKKSRAVAYISTSPFIYTADTQQADSQQTE